MTIIGNEKLRQMYRPGIHVSGFAKFTTTEQNGKLPIRCTYLYGAPELTLMQQPAGALPPKMTYVFGSISATAYLDLVVPTAGVISAASFVTGTAVTADDTNYWTFGVINETQSLTAVDNTTAANTTKATGGSSTVADTPLALTVGSAANCAVAAGDVVRATVTKVSSATTMVGCTLVLTITPTVLGESEGLYVDESAQILTTGESQGLLQARFDTTLNSPYVVIARTGSAPTSNLVFGYSYEGLPA